MQLLSFGNLQICQIAIHIAKDAKGLQARSWVGNSHGTHVMKVYMSSLGWIYYDLEILHKKDKILMIDGFVLKSNKREVGFNIALALVILIYQVVG